MFTKFHQRIVVSTLACVACVTVAHGQSRPGEAAAGAFEQPPTLDAAVILRPEIAKGPNHAVRAAVPTYAGHNQYVIDSDFGVFDAQGNTQLVQRVQEIAAIAKLRAVSRTEQYAEALKKAAKSPVQLAEQLARNPVKTISGVPKGIWKFMNRAGQAVKEVGEDRERNPYEDSAGEQLIGFSKTKRELALELGVDPYSSNETLQKELNGVAWATFGGSMTVRVALAPVGGGAGLVISGVNFTETTTAALRDTSPNDLRRLGLGKLLAWNVPREDAVALLNSPAYSPTNMIQLLEALGQLEGVAGRPAYVRMAAQGIDEIDALFFRRGAQLLARIHREVPLEALIAWDDWPVALTKEGTVIVPLEWDYASLTANAAQFVEALKAAPFGGRKITGYHILLTGVASPRVKEQLAAQGIRLTEKALPGPLQ